MGNKSIVVPDPIYELGVKAVIVGAPTPPVFRVCDGQQIPDGIVRIRRDIPCP